MNTVIEEMLKSYQVDNIYDRKNAMKEIMQDFVAYPVLDFLRKLHFMVGLR